MQAMKGNAVKQSVKGKALTTRQASRMAQNERRKAQRRLSRILSEETGEKVTWKESYSKLQELESASGQAKALGKTIESLTSKPQEGSKARKGYEVSIEKEAESLKTFTYSRFGQETLSKKGKAPDLYRRNQMFTHQINQSTKSEGLSTLDKNETHGFYSATSWIWKDADESDDRNALIMKEFGLNDLKQVYDLIVNKELKPEDFGFKDEEMFKNWLDEIRERVDIDELRKIFHEELSMESDEPDVKYRKVAIGNIRIRTARFKKHG